MGESQCSGHTLDRYGVEPGHGYFLEQSAGRRIDSFSVNGEDEAQRETGACQGHSGT